MFKCLRLTGYFSLLLASSLNAAENVIPMHKDGIWDVEVSPNGKWLATAGGDGTIKIWDAATLQLKITLTQNDRKFQIYDVDFLPDNERIVATQLAGQPVVWNFKSGEKLAELNGHEKMVGRSAVSLDGKLIYTAGADGKVLAWNSETYKIVGSMTFKSPVGLAPQKETGVTVIAGLDGIIIADVMHDQVLMPVTRVERFSAAIRSADGTNLVAGAISGNASPQRLNAASGTLEQIYSGVTSGWGWNIATAPATAKHGPLVAVSYYQGPAVVWDLNSKAILFTSPTDTWQSLSVGFSALGDRLYVGDTEGSLHVIPMTANPSPFVTSTH